MKAFRSFVPAFLILFILTGTAYAVRPVPIIPMKVMGEVDVFIRELNVDDTPVGGYIDMFALQAAKEAESAARNKAGEAALDKIVPLATGTPAKKTDTDKTETATDQKKTATDGEKKTTGNTASSEAGLAKTAAAKYMNASIVPLIQNAVTRSGMFWRIRGLLPKDQLPGNGEDKQTGAKDQNLQKKEGTAAATNDKTLKKEEKIEEGNQDGNGSEIIAWNALGNLYEARVNGSSQSIDKELKTYVILEPSLSIVSGLKKFSGSFGFIINNFLEVNKSKEWIYLTLNLKAEIHNDGSRVPDVINDFIMVPLAKWNRSEMNVGIDRRVLAIALSQISATGIIQEALSLFTDELKNNKDQETLAKIGFKSISSVTDPVQAVAFAIYQSAYRITKRLNIHREFRQRILDQAVETYPGKSSSKRNHLIYADGYRVFMPDPLNITPGATRFRIYKRKHLDDPLELTGTPGGSFGNVGGSGGAIKGETKVYYGELFTAQPFFGADFNLKDEIAKAMFNQRLQPKDIETEYEQYVKDLKSISDSTNPLFSGLTDQAILDNPTIVRGFQLERLANLQDSYVAQLLSIVEDEKRPLKEELKAAIETKQIEDRKKAEGQKMAEGSKNKRTIQDIEADIAAINDKLELVRKKYKAVSQVLLVPGNRFAIKLEGGVNKDLLNALRADQKADKLSDWVVEVAWDWYVEEFNK